MAAYSYQALDTEGREVSGILEADSTRQARNQLREQALFPLSVDAVRAQAGHAATLLRRRLPASELCLITRQWAMLLDAGLTIGQALTALIEQSEHTAARQLLAAVRAEVLAGHSLHQALVQYPHSFPAIYRAVVRAGEKSGELAKLLLRLADYLEAWQNTRQKILQALLYPALVTLVALLVIVGLMTYVVPQIVEVFEQSRQSLPTLTLALIAVSDFLRHQGGWLLLLLVLTAFATRQALQRSPAMQFVWHERLLHLPLLGRHLRTLDSARLASTLAIMTTSGVPLLTALETASAVISNRRLRHGLTEASNRVREGSPLHRALSAEKIFPPLLIHMIASGEASGQLGSMLERAAHQQQNELDRRTAMALSLFEPLLILVMGGLVLLIVLAVLLPIIEINMLLQ